MTIPGQADTGEMVDERQRTATWQTEESYQRLKCLNTHTTDRQEDMTVDRQVDLPHTTIYNHTGLPTGHTHKHR